jgi:formate-dependent nitrite reductase cytochrome c552 subunit
MVQDWSGSIHSQRGVACADCHGGDPAGADKETAHAASANFVGKPNTVDIPALCGSCHARVELMRQYDLPTDQWAKYLQSVHGVELAKGDTNVATCFTCHDGHATKEVTDPSANVYPLNVPALCGGCHSNVELMKSYEIPTNQYELYAKSVHGTALLQNQDLRAPSCATCHGTHGAAPPGFDEVANVCGSCHTATQDYYLKSLHAGDTPGTPECVTCHGRYDVEAPSDAMFHGDGARQCGSCHTPNSPQNATVQAIAENIEASAKAVEEAEKAIKEAAGSALIVAPEEEKLAEAKTNLITARAAQHTLDLDTLKKRTDAATKKADEVTSDAQKAIADSIFRREIMVVGLAIMAMAIFALWLVRRELYKQLPKK